MQDIFSALGSNLNPTLTQLAKSRRAIFVEGKDFQILSAFARKMGYQAVANRNDFAVIPTEGYNPQKVVDIAKGMEITLGTALLKAVIFDRDYRHIDEMSSTKKQLSKITEFVHIHERKELENYLLSPAVILRAMEKRISLYNIRTGGTFRITEDIEDILMRLSDKIKSYVSAQFQNRRVPYEKSKNSNHDATTIIQHIIEEFERHWCLWPQRRMILPGKTILSDFNNYIQNAYRINISWRSIIDEMSIDEIPEEICSLIINIDRFRQKSI